MKNLFTLALLCFVSVSFSQIKVEGFVKDSIGNPLEMANVIAINTGTKTLDSYAITNNNGRYKLSLKPNTAYELKISYVGMKTLETVLQTQKNTITKSFTLQEDNQLDAVELVYEMPVTIKGDTLVYNSDSFTNGTEKKLGDVLKKLPGVEVDTNGEIKVEGKKVTKVMVEGKDFFDGDSKLATKNIPADAVSKVQVLKNYNEVGQLRGVTSNEDKIAINIKLKEGKKNFWFGEITAGAGNSKGKDLYIAHPKLFYYSPKYSVNIITDFNNIGAIPFTRRDYFNFTGGFRNMNSSSGTGFNVTSSDMGFLSLQNNKAKAVDSKFGAANFSYSPTKKLDLSGFAIYSGSRTNLQENASKTYINTNNTSTQDEITENKTHQKNDLGLFKLSASYKKNANNQLDYDAFAKISKQDEFQNLFSSITNNVTENKEQKPFSFNQNFNYYYTANEKNIFALSVQHLWQDEDPFYNAILAQTNTFNFDTVLGIDTNQNSYNINQNKRIKTNKLDAKLDYWYVINNKSNINLTAGSLISSQQFNSEIYQVLDNGNATHLTNALTDVTNTVKYNLTDFFLGVHYRLIKGKFTFTPGFSLHQYHTKNNQKNEDTSLNFFRFLPDFNMRIQLKKSENINFNYSIKTSFTDVAKLAEGSVLNNYNSLYQGNRNLENSLSHNLNLSYFSFNMFNYTNVFAFINYSKQIDQIRNQSVFNGIFTASTPFNSNFADEILSANGRFERRFGKLKASLGGNFSFSKFNQFINNQQSTNTSFSQIYTSKLSTNFKVAPNVEVGYKLNINDYTQRNVTTKYFTHSPFVNVDAYFLKGFIFKADYTYNNYKTSSKTINNYSFLDASLSYQKEASKWEYKVGATNILNTQSLNQNNSNNFFTSTSEYFIQPRYVVLSLKYDL